MYKCNICLVIFSGFLRKYKCPIRKVGLETKTLETQTAQRISRARLISRNDNNIGDFYQKFTLRKLDVKKKMHRR